MHVHCRGGLLELDELVQLCQALRDGSGLESLAALAKFLYDAEAAAPSLRELAGAGLLKPASVLHVLAGPPSKLVKGLAVRGSRQREPLELLLFFLLGQEGMQTPAEDRRLLRHCGAASCEGDQAQRGEAEEGTTAERRQARLTFLSWLDICRCSPLARALLKVEGKPNYPKIQKRDGAYERSLLLYQVSGPPTRLVYPPGCPTPEPEDEAALEAAASAASAAVSAELDKAAWPTATRQMVALWWARAARPHASAEAQLRVARGLLERGRFENVPGEFAQCSLVQQLRDVRAT